MLVGPHARAERVSLRSSSMEHQPTSAAPRDAKSAAETAVSTPSPSTPTGTTGDLLIAEELLVEEISIDGMCGVY